MQQGTPNVTTHTNGSIQRRIVETYDYDDEDGKLLYQVVRYEPKDFRQRKPDGNGDWVWNLHGVRRVLYRLPELIAADPKMPVFVVEGEKDADRLWDAGLIATTNPEGAKKWLPEFSGFLEGRHVVIIPDNDPPGVDHVEKVQQSIYGHARSVRVLELPDLPAKGDISDWLDQGHTGQELIDIARATPQ